MVSGRHWLHWIAPDLQEPRLEPLFPVVPFTPSSECPHSGSIPRGSSFCCMVCHASGRDAHPAFKLDAPDRNNSRAWPEAGARRNYQPGELPGGIGDLASHPRRSVRASIRQAIKDRFWLACMRMAGFSSEDIADREGIDRELVANGILRAIEAEEKKKHANADTRELAT